MMLNRLSFLVGSLLLLNFCAADQPVGSRCHANIDCESNYCNRKQQCELQAQAGAPCPAGFHEACLSYNCEGGFCVEEDTRIHARELQDPDQTGANVTRPPQAMGNNTMAPSVNGTWDGVVPTDANCNNNGTGTDSSNIFMQNDNAMGCNNNVNASVAPRPMDADANGSVTPSPMEGNANASIAPRPMDSNANASIAPLPMDSNANASIAPRPMGEDGDANATVAPSPVPGDSNTTAPAVSPDTPPPEPVVTSCTPDSDVCGEEFFCSSLGVCQELSCENWANYTPAEGVGYSEAPCNAEGADAGTAFCGWDGNCYAYGCEDWYKYGPVAFTGYDPNDEQPLECEDYEDGYDENMNSVTFGCRSWQPGNKAPEAKSWTHFFNRKCTAKPRGSDEFTCYYNRPTTSYSEYQGAVARLNPPSCDREIYDNEQPLYWYLIQMWQERKGETIKYKHGRENTLSSDSFNANLAENSLYAVIVSKNDAPEQTYPEAKDPDQEESGAVTLLVGGLTGFWVIALSFMLS